MTESEGNFNKPHVGTCTALHNDRIPSHRTDKALSPSLLEGGCHFVAVRAWGRSNNWRNKAKQKTSLFASLLPLQCAFLVMRMEREWMSVREEGIQQVWGIEEAGEGRI